MSMQLAATTAIVFAAIACNSVGFHEDSNVDFGRYRSAEIAPFTVSSSYADARPVPNEAVSRFTEELMRLSGFERVGQEAGTADLTIQVDVSRVTIEESSSSGADCCNVVGFVAASLLDAECDDTQVWVEVELAARVVDATGQVLYSLDTADGSSENFDCVSSQELREGYIQALDDALEEIAVFFLEGFEI